LLGLGSVSSAGLQTKQKMVAPQVILPVYNKHLLYNSMNEQVRVTLNSNLSIF
jgi:hypothetical protein